MNVVATTEATSISITWHQAEGDMVDFYEIEYNFSVNAYPEFCDRRSTDPITVVVSGSTVQSYTFSNSITTPVEEDSNYSISLTAVNSAGRSKPAKVKPSTQQAGTWMLIYEYY